MPTRVALKQLPTSYNIKLGLPPGMSMTSDGVLYGLPTEKGIWMFEIAVIGLDGVKTYRTVTLTIHDLNP